MMNEIWTTQRTSTKNIILIDKRGKQFGYGIPVDEAKFAIKALQYAIELIEIDKQFDIDESPIAAEE